MIELRYVEGYSVECHTMPVNCCKEHFCLIVRFRGIYYCSEELDQMSARNMAMLLNTS